MLGLYLLHLYCSRARSRSCAQGWPSCRRAAPAPRRDRDRTVSTLAVARAAAFAATCAAALAAAHAVALAAALTAAAFTIAAITL